MIKLTVIPKKRHLALGNLAKFVFWSILSFISFSLVACFFWGNKRKYFAHIPGPSHPKMQTPFFPPKCFTFILTRRFFPSDTKMEDVKRKFSTFCIVFYLCFGFSKSAAFVAPDCLLLLRDFKIHGVIYIHFLSALLVAGWGLW